MVNHRLSEIRFLEALVAVALLGIVLMMANETVKLALRNYKGNTVRFMIIITLIALFLYFAFLYIVGPIVRAGIEERT